MFWSLFISGNLTVKLCLMLGLSDDILSVNYNYPLLSTVDVFCKSYLKRAWTAHTSYDCIYVTNFVYILLYIILL